MMQSVLQRGNQGCFLIEDFSLELIADLTS